MIHCVRLLTDRVDIRMTEERRAVLSQAGLLGGHVAPLLDHGLLHLLQISLGTSLHSSMGLRRGTSLVTCWHTLKSDDASMVYAKFCIKEGILSGN